MHDINDGDETGINWPGYRTDESMVPAQIKPGERRKVSAACVTDSGRVGAIVDSREAVVMHGELFGIVMALVHGRWTKRIDIRIYSDYLNGLRTIN